MIQGLVVQHLPPQTGDWIPSMSPDQDICAVYSSLVVEVCTAQIDYDRETANAELYFSISHMYFHCKADVPTLELNPSY